MRQTTGTQPAAGRYSAWPFRQRLCACLLTYMGLTGLIISVHAWLCCLVSYFLLLAARTAVDHERSTPLPGCTAIPAKSSASSQSATVQPMPQQRALALRQHLMHMLLVGPTQCAASPTPHCWPNKLHSGMMEGSRGVMRDRHSRINRSSPAAKNGLVRCIPLGSLQ